MTASVFAASVLYWFAVGTSAGRSIDRSIAENRWYGEIADVAEAVIVLVNGVTLGVASVVISVVGRWRRRRERLLPVAGVVGSVVVARAAKSMLERRDPFGGEAERVLGGGFYPSGHAAAAFALAIVAALACTDEGRALCVRVLTIAAAVLGVCLPMVEGHHASDVVAGYLIAAAVTTLAHAVLNAGADAGERRPLVRHLAVGSYFRWFVAAVAAVGAASVISGSAAISLVVLIAMWIIARALLDTSIVAVR